MEPHMDHFSVLELFGGIGGMHSAMQETGKSFSIIGCYEINPSATVVYRSNFPSCQVKEQNILGLSSSSLERLNPDILLMSPPCQPFTRQGLKRDVADSRCQPLLHVLELIAQSSKIPKMILMENVAGFETSEARVKLLNVLKERNYTYQEYLLTPSQFGIPNSRLRYYLIAKLKSCCLTMKPSEKIRYELPVCVCYHYQHMNGKHSSKICSLCNKDVSHSVTNYIREKLAGMISPSKSMLPICLDECKFPLSSFLDNELNPTTYLVREKALLKYAKVFDIVHPSSQGSCCFTKGYAHYVQGTGSVLQHNRNANMNEVFARVLEMDPGDPSYLELLSSLQLRYFTPKEVLSLMFFPSSFQIPPSVSDKQAYKVLGNSVNVFVVTLLILLLME